MFGKFDKKLRPILFYGNNPLSLIGGALTSAAAFVMIGFWVVTIFGHGGSHNPYMGLIFDVFLPGLFVLGLILIPIGIGLRRRRMVATGQVPPVYPPIDLQNPVFRRGIEVVIAATFINFVIVGTATYRSVSYMDSPNFCGQSCHVMAPQWAAYQVSPHSNVACVECHIGSGISAAVQAKVNGTKQLVEVTFHTYPTPIHASLSALRPARETCEQCHRPKRFVGDRLLVKTAFADDEKNSVTRSVIVMHLGGVDSLSQLSGIHGHHLNHFEYVATDATNQNIIAVKAHNADGTVTEYVSTDWKGPVKGVERVMDCMDCHNRATHVFQMPQAAVNQAMRDSSINPALPFVHKQGLQLIQAEYSSQDEAAAKITSGLESYYRTHYPAVWSSQRPQIETSARTLAAIYKRNVFPSMKVKWGTYPNNIGHNDFPGCFRCHDGNHVSKSGKTLTNDCSVCHNLLAVDDKNPKVLTDLGMQ